MYIVERWLSRMSRSPYAEDFILKGGMLLASFGTRRPTVDADALARNMAPPTKKPWLVVSRRLPRSKTRTTVWSSSPGL